MTSVETENYYFTEVFWARFFFHFPSNTVISDSFGKTQKICYIIIPFSTFSCFKCYFYSPFRYHVTNHTFPTWMFFMPLWRAIINSVKKANKRKRNENLKMPHFWQYLTAQMALTERKTSLTTIFPQLLKIIEKNAWNFWKREGKSG